MQERAAAAQPARTSSTGRTGRCGASREGEHAYQLAIALKRSATACLHCGVVGQLGRFGSQQPLFLDLPMHGKQVALRVVRQRYRCAACGHTFLEPLAHMDERRHAMTKRLVAYVQREAPAAHSCERRRQRTILDLLRDRNRSGVVAFVQGPVCISERGRRCAG